MDTFELLLKHYHFRPYIPLEEAGILWGHTEKTMKEKIDAGDIRLPYFTSDGKQKSVKLVRVETIAKILDQRAVDAERDFKNLWR
ncbi:pyocin activator PrtN family protein [Palleronia pelagia]|uniref:Pyocin activator protein PrtN n=1 Tax=Palleronia pelagia TaxID=387096 RepID=A0A1H8BEQ2_9RHOB|nr:pyocin activator PrtN family protein [Palleronia pelagia]SEM81303.1 Pyocin activator protein PrtN [Palleronia pelagia]